MDRLLTILARFESRTVALRHKQRLPPLLILSDRARGFSLEAQITRWPQGAAFIERTYGDAVLARDKRSRQIMTLATCTPHQARIAKLDGLHWPQKRLGLRRKSATRGLIETTSTHGGLALAKAARLGFDAILVSTAFASNSPSAQKPMGAVRLARLQRAFPAAKIYALGGIDAVTVKHLARTGITGVALVSFCRADN